MTKCYKTSQLGCLEIWTSILAYEFITSLSEDGGRSLFFSFVSLMLVKEDSKDRLIKLYQFYYL